MKKKKGKLTLSKETISVMGMKQVLGGDARTGQTKCNQNSCQMGCTTVLNGPCELSKCVMCDPWTGI